MSETFFPINDLLRRRLQTSLIVINLTLCVASTLFLVLFGGKIGFGISLLIEGKLTVGFSTIFSPFIVFIGFLIFVVGAVIMSFMVFVMMAQRIRDIGLMKAVGCPNDMVFGYFFTQLLILTFTGCFFGVILGISADFAATSFFASSGFHISHGPINFWLVLLVFGMFFVLALIFGTKPILNTARVEAARALSPSYYSGLSKEPGFKASSKSGITMKIAVRSLARHKSATFRIILCLTAVFLLATVGIAGGIIADQTTKSWVENAIGRDIAVIAHQDMCSQYRLLLAKFYEANATSPFNYTEGKYLIPDEIITMLGSISNISVIDQRLAIEMEVKELPGYVLGSETSATTEVGDHHEGRSLVVGVEPEKVLGRWFLDGEFLNTNQKMRAVIGDSLSQKMFSMALVQGMKLLGREFEITGVCLDPINNGNVTYVLLEDLQEATGISHANIMMIRISSSSNRTHVLNQLRQEIRTVNSEFEVMDLNEVLDASLGFLGYIWSTIMFLPLFSLFAASLCLLAYVVLTVDEQRKELGVLRALGAKPKTILKIVSEQSLIVLLSSCAIGISFGIIITLLILIPDPVITVHTIMEIAAWLLTALGATFILSLYPAVRFANKPLIEAMA